MSCVHIRGHVQEDEHQRVVLVTDPTSVTAKYYVPFMYCPLCGLSYADEAEEAEAMRTAEKCPKCSDGVLRGASGGGVKCNKCSYWFCF